jgi:hypothetical protein
MDTLKPFLDPILRNMSFKNSEKDHMPAPAEVPSRMEQGPVNSLQR